MGKTLLIAAAMLLSSSISYAATLIDFEGLNNNEPVDQYYDGNGRGPNYGIDFSPNALALKSTTVGGSGNFVGEPSPSTVLFFLTGPASTMNVGNGFTGGFSFYYTSVNFGGYIKVYDGLDATGNVLATLQLPVTLAPLHPKFGPFYPIGVSFEGTALSIDFGGAVNNIGFDNITIGSTTPIGPKPGDCNRNGILTIDEIQDAINMSEGRQSLDHCVDVSWDGSVTWDEVQNTINSYLGL